MIVALCIIAILVIICVVCFIKLSKKKKIDKEIEEQNSELRKVNFDLKSQNDILYKRTLNLQSAINQYEYKNDCILAEINNHQSLLDNIIEQNQTISANAFTEYCKTLEYSYVDFERRIDDEARDLIEKIAQTKEELDKLKATRAAAHEALLKEQEVKENKDNYRLIPNDSDLADSRRLEIVKRELNKPRILCMLIWQTYWQPLAKKIFPIILQDKTKCGIYKITNLITEECYIGQAVDIYKRWCEHCKAGLGIDTPPGNKLYKSMQEYGLENFTFELLTECTTLELNEKEKYFIELYQSNIYGMNSTGGNK